MRNVILLMLFCGSANAGIYSCVDDSGKKALRSEPCEQNEKQQPIVIKAPPSHYVINSTGEKQGIDSYQAKQAPRTIVQSVAPKNLYERAKAEANSSRDQSPETRAAIMDRVIRAYRAEHCGANAQAPQNDSSQQSLYDRAKTEANSSRDQRSEVRAGIMNRFIRAYRAERCMPEDARDETNSPRSAINTQTGEFMPGVPGGVINPRTGTFYPAVTGGFINPATGQFIPAQ